MPLRPASKDDVSELYDMVVELAKFEKFESEVTLSREKFSKDFENGCFYGFIVIDDETGKSAGMVLYHFRYDCWTGKYMNELLVRSEFRNKKYGKQLWAAVAKVAKENDVGLITWSVLDWNKPAINFYDSVAGVSEEKNEAGFLRYKMTREGIDRF
ncbi:hypothetical protein PMAYCL1PPCAC_15734, partial [Pristionchus mayeri]